MLRFVQFLSCVILSGVFLSACTVFQPILPVGPDEFRPRAIGQITPGGVFSPDPQAEKVAVERGALYLISTDAGTEKILSDKKPLALAWSVDGERLAAVFSEGEQSRLVVYNADGLENTSFLTPGRLTQLAWTPEGELLALSIQLKTFSFGTNLKAVLLRWNSQKLPAKESLFETTLKPRTVAELGEELYQLFRFDLSLFGDEIAYTRLYDPPVIRKSIKVIHRHLTARAERLVYDLPLQSGGSLWSFDSESLLMSDGGSRTFLFDLWQHRFLQSWPLPGQHLALSPMENMVFIDGYLYRDEQEIARLQSGRAVFSQNGKHLLVAGQGNLFMYSLPSVEVVSPLAERTKERLLLLREFRSKNLLTVEEYNDAREGLLQ